MKWFIFFASLALMGFTQLSTTHESQKKVDDEFTNVYNQAQGRQFTIVTTTPNLSDLRDGEMVIYGSTLTTTVGIMFRQGLELYKVNASCITVRR